jgi:hypothetical protein
VHNTKLDQAIGDALFCPVVLNPYLPVPNIEVGDAAVNALMFVPAHGQKLIVIMRGVRSNEPLIFCQRCFDCLTKDVASSFPGRSILLPGRVYFCIKSYFLIDLFNDQSAVNRWQAQVLVLTIY